MSESVKREWLKSGDQESGASEWQERVIRVQEYRVAEWMVGRLSKRELHRGGREAAREVAEQVKISQ